MFLVESVADDAVRVLNCFFVAVAFLLLLCIVLACMWLLSSFLLFLLFVRCYGRSVIRCPVDLFLCDIDVLICIYIYIYTFDVVSCFRNLCL